MYFVGKQKPLEQTRVCLSGGAKLPSAQFQEFNLGDLEGVEGPEATLFHPNNLRGDFLDLDFCHVR